MFEATVKDALSAGAGGLIGYMGGLLAGLSQPEATVLAAVLTLTGLLGRAGMDFYFKRKDWKGLLKQVEDLKAEVVELKDTIVLLRRQLQVVMIGKKK